jgi:hypothetical protein
LVDTDLIRLDFHIQDFSFERAPCVQARAPVCGSADHRICDVKDRAKRV